MKRVVILCICLMSSGISQAVEYGYFIRNNASEDWNASVSLNANDRFVLINVYPELNQAGATFSHEGAFIKRAHFDVQYDNITVIRPLPVREGYRSSNVFELSAVHENERIIIGPCSITPSWVSNYDENSAQIIEYKIIRAGEDESKYTVSLNADGTRMAIGEQSGTNGVARVFEYNGTDWNQLGSDVQ